jgi:P27 family predicted phage terminase small subunit
MPMPEAPSHLSEAAVKEWDRVVEELTGSGMLTGLDMGALAAYCQAYGRWVDAESVLSKMVNTAEGLIIKTVSGNYIQNPIVGVANKAMSDMVKFASEFGMTPSARSRVVVSKGGEKKNGFTEINRLK